jgi:alpha-amylase/alpha-mannosidase (GH57 family)
VYRQLVIPSQVSLEQVVAHYAMSSLFTTFYPEQRLYCYTIFQHDYQVQRIGPLSLAVGRLQVISEVTSDRTDLSFAVLHLGGWDFHCCVQGFRRRLDYQQAAEMVLAAFETASAAQVIVAINEAFGDLAYNLQTLFTEERHRIMQLLSQETLQKLDQLYSQVYRNNYSLIKGFIRDGLPVPQELHVAAEVAIKHRALEELRALDQNITDQQTPLARGVTHLSQLETIAHEAQQFHCNVTFPEGQRILEGLLWRSLRQFLAAPNPDTLLEEVEWLQRLINLGDALGGISLVRTQELYWNQIHQWFEFLEGHPPEHIERSLNPLLYLGESLAIDPQALLVHGAGLTP